MQRELNGTGTTPSALSRWFATFRDDVLKGRVSLEELIAVADADMQAEAIELCPACSHVIHKGMGYKHGTCSVCWLYRLRDGHLEALRQLEAQQEYNAAKKQLQRRRDELGVKAPGRHASAEDYGRASMGGSNEPLPFATCEACGEPFRVHTGASDTVCPECRERALQRARRAGEL